jgi:EAL domain-containing protein (putative c-di-GMP-specific phosphodiesterase class I)
VNTGAWLWGCLGLLLLGGIGYYSLRGILAWRTRALRVALAQCEQAERALRYRVQLDPQTQLARPAYFIDQLDDFFHRQSLPVAQPKEVLILKLCYLDEQVHRFGVARTDALIDLVARQLHQLPLELSGYLGRGVFVLFADRATGAEWLAQLQLALSGDALGRSAHLTAGSAYWPEQGRSAAKLMRSAETALATAIVRRARWLAYAPDMEPAHLEQDILALFMAGDVAGLYPVLQPQLDLRSGKIHSAEMLVRWQHPRLGAVAPEVFLPLLAAAGLMAPLSQWLLEAAVRLAAELRREGVICCIGVKLSAQDLLETDVVAIVTAALQCYGGQPQDLKLALSAAVVAANSAALKRLLERLDALGIPLVLDDFGACQCALAELGYLPFSELKIAASLGGVIALNARSGSLVRASILLARELGLSALVEGVADDKSLQQVRREGCDLAQGSVIASPLCKVEFMEFMRAHAQVGFSLPPLR